MCVVANMMLACAPLALQASKQVAMESLRQADLATTLYENHAIAQAMLSSEDRVKEGLEAEAIAHDIIDDATREKVIAGIPIGRMARPEEIANVVTFLISDLASYVKGVIMAMDGAANPIVT